MPVIIAIYGMLYFSFGSVINKNDGLGFDGYYYGQIAKDFYNLVSTNQLTFYRIQKIFPSFLVNLILSVLNLPKENVYVIKTFQILNIILLIFTSLIWNKVSKIFNLDIKFVWLGFVFAFVNYNIGEWSFYYPVLTDSMAYFLGFCLLYFYLKENLAGKVIVTVVGAFTFATFIYFGLLLILMPLKLNSGIYSGMKDEGKYFKKYIAVLLPLPFIATSVYYINNFFSGSGIFEGIYTPAFTSLLYVNAFLNYALLIYFTGVFLPERFSISNLSVFIRNILSNLKLGNVIISIILFSSVFIIQKLNSSHGKTEVTFSDLYYYLTVYSITKPMVYFVLSVTSAGPVYIIIFFFMKYFKPHLKKLGIGIYLIFLISFPMIFTGESRFVINVFPVLVLLTVLVLRDLKINNAIMFMITIASLVLSKVYFPMRMVRLDGIEFYQYFKFPYQLFFMNSFSVSKYFYIVQGIFIAAISVYLVMSIKKNYAYTVNKN